MIFQQNLISSTGSLLMESAFAFERNMRGFRYVKPPVHY